MRIVFILPEILEEALWALPIMQRYVMEKRGAKKTIDSFTIYCPLGEIWYLVWAFCPEAALSLKPPQEALQTADLVFEFNAERAFQLSVSPKKHITEVYGIMLGAIPSQKLLTIARTASESEFLRLLYVPRHKLDGRWEWVWPHKKRVFEIAESVKVNLVELPFDVDVRTAQEEISKASIVFGVRGSLTLLATSMAQPCLELYPESEQFPEWMDKWEQPFYRMVHAELQDIDPNFIWARLGEMLAEVASKENKPWAGTPSSRNSSSQVRVAGS